MTSTPAPIKPPIEIADLEKIDIRVGTILSVQDVGNSDKLVKLLVSFGDHQRTIIAGMKQERENPKEIEGKQALFVINLPPRKMRGEVSEGMLFDIGYADGHFSRQQVDHEQSLLAFNLFRILSLLFHPGDDCSLMIAEGDQELHQLLRVTDVLHR